MANTNNPQQYGSWVTPEMLGNPALAYTAASSPNPQAASTTLSHVANVSAVQNAVADNAQTYDTGSFWNNLTSAASGAFSWAAKPVGTALEWLNKPLQEISKDYKFLHAVYTDHGVGAGVLATLGVAAGGALGIAGGAAGVAAGADIAATGIRQLMGRTVWQDSYNKSEDPNYQISFGRDFSNALGTAAAAVGQQNWAKAFRDTNSGLGKIVSGATDATFDVGADPINVLGKASFLMRNGSLIKATGNEINLTFNTPFQDSIKPITDFLTARSQRFISPSQMDAMRASNSFVFNGVSRGYNRFLDRVGEIVTDVAPKDAAAQNEFYAANKIQAIDPQTGMPSGGIMQTNATNMAIGRLQQEFPELGQQGAAAIVAASRNAKTVAQVADITHDVMKTKVLEGELASTYAGSALVPTQSVIRSGLQPVTDALANAQVAGRDVGKIYRTFTGYMPRSVDPTTWQQSLSTVGINSPDAASALGAMMNFSQNRRFAIDMMGQYSSAVATGNIGLARAVWKQGIFEMMKGLGLSDDLAEAEWQKLGEVPLSSSHDALYGVAGNELGALGSYENNAGQGAAAGLFTHQMNDSLAIPNFFEMRKLLREQGEFSGMLRTQWGRIGDFVAQHYTNTIFKPLALMTAGFGMRVAAAELIPQAARYGVTNLLKGGLLWSSAKSNYSMDQRNFESAFADNAATRTAHLEGLRTNGVDQTPALEANALADTVATTLSNGRAINKDTVTKGFNAFRDNVTRMQLKFAAKMTSQEQANFATDLIYRLNGHLPDALDPAHGAMAATDRYGDIVHAVAVNKHMAANVGDLNKFRLFLGSDPGFNTAWLSNLQKASQNHAQQLLTRDALDQLAGVGKVPLTLADQDAAFRQTLVQREYDRLLQAKNGEGPYYGPNRESHLSQRFADQDLRSFAAERVDANLGNLIGQDGTFHENLANMIASGRKPAIADIEKITDPTMLPKATPGQTKYLYIPGKGALLPRVINFGFKKVMDPIVSHIAREPVFMVKAADEYKSLEHAVATGALDHDTAMKIAMTRSVYGMLPEIHNVMLRSQFAQLARNYLPFYFAQEQAMRRTLKAMQDTGAASPITSSAFRYFQMLEHTLSDPSIVTDDGSGNKYVNIPLAGPLGQWIQSGLSHLGMPMVSNLPLSVSGNLASLQSVLPEMQMPGVSPMGAYSIDLFNRLMPEFGPAPLSKTIQTLKDAGTAIAGRSANRNFWDTVIPNAAMKNAFAALSMDEQQSAVSNAIITAIAAAGYHNQIPAATASAADKQAFIDRIKNNARSVLIVKAMFGMLSPLAPKVEQTDPGLRNEFMNLVRTTGDYQSALLKFLGEHGNNAVSYTIAKTTAAVPGANVQYTQEVSNWLKNHAALVHDPSTSTGALYLLPQQPATSVDWNVYNELLRQHLRMQRTPTDFLNQFYIASGDAAVNNDMQQHNQAVQQYSGNPYMLHQEQQRWSQVLDTMKHLYPDWYQSYTSGAGKVNAQKAADQLQTIFRSPNAPTDDYANAVKNLTVEYVRHAQELAQWKQLQNTTMSNMAKQQWQAQLQAAEAQDPRLSTVIKSVFGKLD